MILSGEKDKEIRGLAENLIAYCRENVKKRCMYCTFNVTHNVFPGDYETLPSCSLYGHPYDSNYAMGYVDKKLSFKDGPAVHEAWIEALTAEAVAEGADDHLKKDVA